ncbi:DNA-methyltransferase [Nocardiopsis protaetiae]|uniref:DNA-methyltransferase n=1 Tax=Nocardiopsis protaetiae TaxID=3382270 RepID=UPI00387B5149
MAEQLRLDTPDMPPARVLHESDLCTLVLGDARDPATRPPGTYDLLCTDPPYGVRWESGRRTETYGELAGDDGSIDWPAVLGQWTGTYTRGLRTRRHAYVFGYTPDQLAEPLHFGGTAGLIWNKRHIGPGDLASPWGREHEQIAFGVHTLSPSGRAKGDGRLSARLRQGSVITAKRPNSGAVRHPTEKPLALMRQLVESSTVLGDLVVDPCAGTGSTLVAAILTGRRAWGVEIDPRWADIALTRIRRAEDIARQAATA